ncbi:GIY-YIG nuclease family protein [Virgibacillus byunsanensis]|uniref:GIY-YIG nuclease family protein n=1 Tax=Virgibacillus byunsanensis TaxID=570945 RepID=A0ABW3LPN8_9BACI
MFGTIIQDAYKENEKDDLAYAINDICNPNDNNGWASAGIYCFWNYQTREILYIGLARDLSERLKQHNGLITIDPKGCKVENINEYFNENEKMGHSIFVQSSNHQPVTSRNIFDLFRKDPELGNVKEYDDEPVKQDYIMTEGILIEAYNKMFNTIPPWNKIAGSKKGQLASTIGNYEIVKFFSSKDPSPLLARYSIREISNNPTYERYELFLHTARQQMLTTGITFLDAIKFSRSFDMLETYEELFSVEYFNRILDI